MAAISAEFGFLPCELNASCGPISISTLPGLTQSVEDVRSSGVIEGDWIYAPHAQRRDVFNDKTYQLPYPSRIFGLPKTHVLEHGAADGPGNLQFLIWCLGFFEGMRLTTTERGFLDSTPIKRHVLSDFILHDKCEVAIKLAESFWQQHSGHHRRTKRVEAVIHALFVSANPLNLEYERFMYLYLALDGCYELTRDLFGGNSSGHGLRIQWMCQKFGIPIPVWVQPVAAATNKSQVSMTRNDTLHEALFNEEPLGFAVLGDAQGVPGMPLQMQALVCRLLVALLGKPECGYVSTSVDSRQRYGLKLA